MAHLMEFEKMVNKRPIPAWLQPVSTPLIWRVDKRFGRASGPKLQMLYSEWNSPWFSHRFSLQTPPMQIRSISHAVSHNKFCRREGIPGYRGVHWEDNWPSASWSITSWYPVQSIRSDTKVGATWKVGADTGPVKPRWGQCQCRDRAGAVLGALSGTPTNCEAG